MKVKILNFGEKPIWAFMPDLEGALYLGNVTYEIINKQKFMLTAMKYGIVFDVINE